MRKYETSWGWSCAKLKFSLVEVEIEVEVDIEVGVKVEAGVEVKVGVAI